jgi:hypothetical protein
MLSVAAPHRYPRTTMTLPAQPRRALAVLAAAVALLAAPHAAQAEASIGPHAGLNFDWEEVVIGGEARVDMAQLSGNITLQLDPAVTFAFPGSGVAMDFSLNMPFVFVIRDSVLRPFSGPGLALIHYTGGSGGTSVTDLYFNILAGLLFDLGTVDPFVQLKVMVPHGSMAELIGGVLFTL